MAIPGGAYGGALLGMGLGVLAFTCADERIALVAMGVLTPAGAVVGYNIGDPMDGDVVARFSPPAVALSTRLSPGRQVHTVVDCRLVTMGF